MDFSLNILSRYEVQWDRGTQLPSFILDVLTRHGEAIDGKYRVDEIIVAFSEIKQKCKKIGRFDCHEENELTLRLISKAGNLPIIIKAVR